MQAATNAEVFEDMTQTHTIFFYLKESFTRFHPAGCYFIDFHGFPEI